MSATNSFLSERRKPIPNCSEVEPGLNDDDSVLSADQRSYVWAVKYLYSLNADWTIFKELFAESQERIESLYKYSGWVIDHIRLSLSDRVALGAAKFIDDKGHALNRLTTFPLRHGLSKAERIKISSPREALKLRCEELEAAHPVLMDHRDKRLAHDDYSILTKTATIDDLDTIIIESALADVCEIFSDISELRYGSGVGFMGVEFEMAPACERFLKLIEFGNGRMETRLKEIDAVREQLRRGELPQNFGPQMMRL